VIALYTTEAIPLSKSSIKI